MNRRYSDPKLDEAHALGFREGYRLARGSEPPYGEHLADPEDILRALTSSAPMGPAHTHEFEPTTGDGRAFRARIHEAIETADREQDEVYTIIGQAAADARDGEALRVLRAALPRSIECEVYGTHSAPSLRVEIEPDAIHVDVGHYCHGGYDWAPLATGSGSTIAAAATACLDAFRGR